MKKENEPIPALSMPELDLIEWKRELASFQNELIKPINKKTLDQWSSTSVYGGLILAGTVWGTIRWKKSIGRPTSATLSSAFEIYYHHVQQKGEYTPDGGYKVINLIVPHKVSKWDGPDDNEYHRVSFLTDAAIGTPNIVIIQFAPEIYWEFVAHIRGAGTYRRIDPPHHSFTPLDSKPLVLEPFEVAYHRLKP